MKVWTYWEGDIPPIIQLCLDTMERHNEDFQIITPDAVQNEPGGEEVWDFVKDLPIPQRSDFIRLWWLHRFGGVWNDSDCIQTDSFDFTPCDLLGITNPHTRRGFGVNGILATPWACREGSPVIKKGLDMCRHYLEKIKRGEHVSYGTTSVGILSRLWKEREETEDIVRRQHWRYNRVPWYHCRQAFRQVRQPRGHEQSQWWVPNVVNFHLTNVVPDMTKNLTRGQILREGKKSSPFYSFVFQKALGLHPAIFGRSKEILNRLPPGPVRGAEIGVFRGMNSRNLLQQRKDLHLTLVDPWGPVEDQVSDYRTTRDFQATMGQKKWDNTFRFVGETLSFAQDRFVRHRMASHQAFDKVPDGSLDFVFIDGNHSYEGVKLDLKWWDKVKPGGFIGGHDYNQPKNRSGAYGVNRAVDEFVQLINAPLELGIDWTWFVRKPGQAG